MSLQELLIHLQEAHYFGFLWKVTVSHVGLLGNNSDQVEITESLWLFGCFQFHISIKLLNFPQIFTKFGT